MKAFMAILGIVSMSLFSFLNNDYDYDKAWNEVENLVYKGRPKSALEKVDKIYEIAVQEKNTVQQVKATTYRTNLVLDTEELGLETVISELNTRIENSKSPEKQILQSLSAELIQNYYNNNRWTIKQRTDLSERTDDIRTWSPNNYREYITDLYLKSVELNPKKYPIEGYEPLIYNYEQSDKELRPTLFFLLMDKANTHFSHEFFDGNNAVNRFVMMGEQYFAPYDEFVNSQFKSANLEAFAYRKILMFQKAMTSAPNQVMKAHYDVARLQFVYNQIADESQKEDWYTNALLKGENSVSNSLKELYAIPYIQRLQSQEKYEEALAKIKEVYAYASKNGKNELDNIKMSIEQPTIYMECKTTYSSQQDIEILIQSKNLDNVTLSICKADYNKYHKKNGGQTEKYVKRLSTIYKKDFNVNSSYKKEKKVLSLDKLPYGFYILKVTNKQGVNEYTTFWVTDIAVNTFDSNNNNTLIVRNRHSGRPIANAQVEIYENKWNTFYKDNYISTQSTDKNGSIDVKSKDNRLVFVVKNGQDQYIFENYMSSYYRDYQKDGQVDIFTDRAIYRPGQTVYFKGVATDFDKNDVPFVLTDQTFETVLRDANGQELQKTSLTTNEFGSFSGSFILPKGRLTGNYQIQINGNRIHSYEYIKVEEYKRPKFEINFEELTDRLKLNDTITAKGQAKYLSGANISNASVSYKINRVENVWGCYYYWYRPSSGMITQGNIETDEKGNFEIPFLASTDGKEGSFTYTVDVDITDSNGETRSKSWSITLSSFDYRFEVVGIKDFDTRDGHKFTIKAKNAQGKSLDASANVSVYYNETQTNIFSAFGNENERQQEVKKGKQVFTKQIAVTPSGYALDVSNLKGGSYVIVITDTENDKITYENVFKVSDFTNGDFAKDDILYFCGTNEEYEVGQIIGIELGTAYPELWVHYMWLNEDNILKQGWTTLDNIQNIRYMPTQKDQGGISLLLSTVKNGKDFTYNLDIEIPWDDKEIAIKLLTEKDKTLPGSEENWSFEITGKNGKIDGELLATMYDASLDQFIAHDFYYDVFPDHFTDSYNDFIGFGENYFNTINYDWNRRKYKEVKQPIYPVLMGINLYDVVTTGRALKGSVSGLAIRSMKKSSSEPEMMMSEAVSTDANYNSTSTRTPPPPPPSPGAPGVDRAKAEKVLSKKKDIPARENLNETTFFYPNIPIKDGKANIKFKMGDALTTWKLLTFAHDKDLRHGIYEHTIKTQKELMIQPNGPRFFREGDKIIFPATITNLTDKPLSVEAGLSLESDGVDVSNTFGYKPNKNIDVPAGQSVKVSWEMNIPNDFKQLLTYKVWASSAKHQDAEKGMIPVLTNQKLINDTEIISLRSGQKKEIDLSSMSGNPYRFTFEYTSNPVWYAVQALPYVQDDNSVSITSVFNRYYTNKLASHIARSNPRIKAVIDQWRAEGSEALISNLEKNAELKEMLLQETPWLRDAKDETEQKQRIFQLFDENNIAQQERETLEELKSRQNADGGWGWCYDKSSVYTTLVILDGIGRLQTLGVKGFDELNPTIDRAVAYLDRKIEKRYDDLKTSVKRNGGNMKDDHLDYTSIYQLYVRRNFSNPWLSQSKDAYDYYLGQSEKYWLGKGLQAEAKIGLYLFDRNSKVVDDIKVSLEERSFYSEDLGRYWNLGNGYNWYDIPVSTQSQLIEFFNKAGNDPQFVEDAKIWLLKNKQTNNWGTYTSTVDAIYALLIDNGNTNAGEWINDTSLPKVYFDEVEQSFSEVEKGTGYFKLQYSGNDAKNKQPKKITIKNNSKTIGWGAVYVQHFKALDQVKANRDNPLNIRKTLYKEITDDNGTRLEEVKDAGKLKIGDRVITRIEIKSDRGMDYVTLKDMRPSGFEPENVISQYKWNHGLGYYESTRDLASHFFISHLRKGTYVFEYPQRVVHEGNYSSGISIIQCEYAPEFTSHSEGVRVNVQ